MTSSGRHSSSTWWCRCSLLCMATLLLLPLLGQGAALRWCGRHRRLCLPDRLLWWIHRVGAPCRVHWSKKLNVSWCGWVLVKCLICAAIKSLLSGRCCTWSKSIWAKLQNTWGLVCWVRCVLHCVRGEGHDSLPACQRTLCQGQLPGCSIVRNCLIRILPTVASTNEQTGKSKSAERSDWWLLII